MYCFLCEFCDVLLSFLFDERIYHSYCVSYCTGTRVVLIVVRSFWRRSSWHNNVKLSQVR